MENFLWRDWDVFVGLIPDIPKRVWPLAYSMALVPRTAPQAAGTSFFGLSGFV